MIVETTIFSVYICPKWMLFTPPAAAAETEATEARCGQIPQQQQMVALMG